MDNQSPDPFQKSSPGESVSRGGASQATAKLQNSEGEGLSPFSEISQGRSPASSSEPTDEGLDIGVSTPVGTRRSFMTRVTAAISAFIGLGLASPLIGYVIYPAFIRQKKTWTAVAKIEDLPVGIPKALDYSVSLKDGWMETKAVKAIWALKQPNNDITVYSPICPHLGCGFQWSGSDQKFKCPCHGSVYALSGEVLGGPAPRPLDVLPSKVENGKLLIIYKEFKSGLKEQVEI